MCRSRVIVCACQSQAGRLTVIVDRVVWLVKYSAVTAHVATDASIQRLIHVESDMERL